MNMNGIYASKPETIAVTKDHEETKVSFEKGQQIEGIISKVSNEISINFSGREFNFSKETVQNAKEGEVRLFEVMDVSKKGIVLKEVGRTIADKAVHKDKTSETMIASDKNLVLEKKTKEQTTEDELANVANSMTEEDYGELCKEGYCVESMTLERLNAALSRIKEQRVLRNQAVCDQIVKLQESREQVREAFKNVAVDSAVADRIADKLVEMDLPVTKENIKSMLHTMELAKHANELSDAGCVYLLENELAPTAQNIYRAIHSGASINAKVSEEVWQEMEQEVIGRLTAFGSFEVEKHLPNAKWLIEHDLAVTQRNLNYKKFLDEIRTGDRLGMSVHLAAAQLTDGQSIIESLEDERRREAATAIVSEVARFTDEDVLYALRTKRTENRAQEDSRELTLSMLRHANKERKEEHKPEERNHSNTDDEQVTLLDIKEVSAKRHLEEIRLRLTIDAGNKMLAKGFHIDTEPLSKVVEELRGMEKQYFQRLAKETGLSSHEEISLLQQSSEHLQQLREAPNVILGVTFTNRFIQTVESLSDIGNSYEARMKQAGERYETLMTRPREDMGDSIKKAFEHVDTMLDQLSLEHTRANERAVRILAYNTMEITQENINTMKAYDALVNDLFTNLTPAVTATLIKEGINPLNLSIYELNRKAIEIRQGLGADAIGSYSEHLVELENKHEISSEERASYIGVYRLLHQVDQTDGAAIGSLVKSGQEITLNHLLTAVRTRKHGAIDQNIDDDFGVLIEQRKRGISITEQISGAFQSMEPENTRRVQAEANSEDPLNEMQDYQSSLWSKVMKELTPDRLSELLANGQDEFYNMSLEELKEALEYHNGTMWTQKASASSDASFYDQLSYQQLQELSRDSIEEQHFLHDYGLANTLQNISAAKEAARNPRFLFQEVKELERKLHKKEDSTELGQQLLSCFHDKEQLQQEYAKFQQRTEQLVSEALEADKLNLADLQQIFKVRNSLRLSSSLSQREYYNIPIETPMGTMAMNVTIFHEEEMKGQARVRIPVPRGEDIFAELQMTGKSVKCFVSTRDRGEIEILRKSREELLHSLKESGYEVAELYFDTRRMGGSGLMRQQGAVYQPQGKINQTDSEKDNAVITENSTGTNDLYLAAKTVILHLNKRMTGAVMHRNGVSNEN